MYGEKIKMYYDPRGQVIKTENPDGSEQRVVYGIPDSLTTPNYYAPTAWETYTYDANDLTVTSADYGTPKSAEVDALGRTIKTLDRLESSNSVTNNVRMQYSYDVRGNLLQVTDAYERTVFRHVYDLRPPAKEGEGIPPLKTVHINKGTSTVVFDCTGKPVETRDAKGALTLHTYDVLQRPTSVWCRDIDTEEVTLRNYLEYGTDNSNNNKGKPTKNYNESGLLRTENYDFKGNLLAKFQQAIANEKIQHVIDESSTSGWTDIKCYRVDWKGLPGDLLGGPEYRTDMEYDALNRLMQLTYPEDASSTRKVLVPTYNKAGALQQVVVDGTPYVNQIGYNAKGQRLIIAYGNGLMTRYTYNALTFRLTRMRTESYTTSQSGNQHTYAYTSGTCKQDMAYTYDKVGNILSITNAAPQSGVGGSSTLEREFDYDALYRLLSATGRENQPTGLYWDDSYRSDDVNTTTAYTQNYDYDLMGNLNELQHTGDTNFTRTYNHTDNLLESFEVGSNTYYYQYDVCGNQIQENEERHMQWDYADKLRLYYNQTSSGTEPSVYTHYLYDAGGNRVKKYTRTAGGNWETITYIDGLIEYREDQDGKIQNINHVMDDTKRIATIRDGYDFGDTTPKIKYNFDDHLGSSNILVDDSGTLVNQEEYYPFGETSFGAYAKKRYRFCGKEKDEESGMYYYGARYYSPWLCRFISVDPLAGKYVFQAAYAYADNNPINKMDYNGEGTGEGGSPNPKESKPIFDIKVVPKSERNSDNFEDVITVDIIPENLPKPYKGKVNNIGELMSQMNNVPSKPGEDDQKSGQQERQRIFGLSRRQNDYINFRSSKSAKAKGGSIIDVVTEVIISAEPFFETDRKIANREIKAEASILNDAVNSVLKAYKIGMIPEQFADFAKNEKFLAELVQYVYDGKSLPAVISEKTNAYANIIKTIGDEIRANQKSILNDKYSLPLLEIRTNPALDNSNALGLNKRYTIGIAPSNFTTTLNGWVNKFNSLKYSNTNSQIKSK
jgi:RHS repeat-associated protein